MKTVQRWLKAGLLLVVVVGLVFLAGIWADFAEAEARARDAAAPLSPAEFVSDDGLNRLLQFAAAHLGDEYQAVFNWHGTLDKETAILLNGHLTTEDDSPSGWQALLSVDQPTADERIHAAIELRADPANSGDWLTASNIEAVRSHIQNILDDGGAVGDWSVKLNGTWTGAGTDETKTASAMQRQVADMLQVAANSIYLDKGIINITYGSQYGGGINGQHTAAAVLQTALHRDTETGSWKLSIGAPMLTGEF